MNKLYIVTLQANDDHFTELVQALNMDDAKEIAEIRNDHHYKAVNVRRAACFVRGLSS